VEDKVMFHCSEHCVPFGSKGFIMLFSGRLVLISRMLFSGNVFLRSIDDYSQLNAVYNGYFPHDPLVRTVIQPNAGYEKNDM
jgi:hypothetical protein